MKKERNIPPAEEWVDLYGDYLYRYALMRLKDDYAAQDVVQETFMAGIKNLATFDGRVDTKYWLRGILRNKVVDYIRKAVREKPITDNEDEEILESLLFKASGIPTMHPDPWKFDPTAEYDNKEFWKVFQSCLSKLKGPLRQVFTMKMLDDMDSDEVCRILDITPSNLWVLNHRARKQLKACLELNWITA